MLKSLLIALPMLVCGIFTVELLLSWLHKKDVSQGWLSLWALVATLLYGGHFFYFHHSTSWIPLSDSIYIACNLAVYPLYLVYISTLTDSRPFSKQPLMLTLLLGPAVLLGIAAAFLYTQMTERETATFISSYLYQGVYQDLHGLPLAQSIIHVTAHLVFAVQVVAVMVTGIRKIHRYNRQLKYLYADTEDKELAGITVILWLFVATSLISVFVNAIGREHFCDTLQLAFVSVVFSTLLFSIGWIGLHTYSLAIEMNQDAAPLEPQPAEALTSSDSYILAMQFDQLMNSEQIYLKHDLRLDAIARRLGTNRTYLLAALRQEMDTTFNEYVNRKRINFARQLMTNNPSMLKSEIAARAGYNSMSAFYRNLKTFND